MTYREHVHRVIAKHHARLEMGLAQARKQARFVERVADIFYKNHTVYAFHLNDDFDVIFYLNGFLGSLKSLFPHFWVEEDGTEWVMCNPNIPEIQVIIRLEAMP